MRLIKDGNYNITLPYRERWGDYRLTSYNSVVEPNEHAVLAALNGSNITCIQHINYFLQETEAGYIFEVEDPVYVKAGFSYLKFLQWIDQRYENKEFSWQHVEEDL